MPRTGGYREVIALLGDSAGGGGDVAVPPGTLAQIADATLDASLDGLLLARGDVGLAYCVHLMVLITQAARDPDFLLALERSGVPTPAAISGLPDVPVLSAPDEFTTFDLTSGFSSAVDRHLRVHRARTDVGELAQLAAAECLSALCADATAVLFTAPTSTVQHSLRGLSTQRGFGRLAHEFFATFIRRFLEYHLSRELSNHVGGRRRFRNVDEHNDFLRQLDRHCRVCTSVLKEYAGDWYSKHNYLADMSLDTAQRFVAYALQKVRDAMQYQEDRDGRS